MPPSQQRLEAIGHAGRGIEDRLVAEFELIEFQRPEQVFLQQPAVQILALRRRLMAPYRAAASAFCPV